MNDEPEPTELERLYGRVRADLERDRGVRGWLRSRHVWQRAAILGATAVVAISVPTLAMGSVTIARIDGWLCSVGALLVLLAVSIAATVRPLYRPRAGVGGGVWLAGLAAASLVAMLLASDGSPGSIESLRCAVLGAMVGAPVLIVGFLVDRTPGRNVALAGSVAALGGMVAAQLLCPLRGLWHIVGDHFGGLVLLAAAFGAGHWVLARLERPSVG